MGTLQFTEEVLTTYKMRIAVIVALFACVAYASACAACGGGGGGHSHSYGSSCGHSHSSHSHSSHSSSSSCGGSGGYRPPKCRKLHFADLPNGGVLNYQKIKHNDVDANSNVRPHIPSLPQNCFSAPKLRNNKDISAFPISNTGLPAAYSCQFKPSKPSCGHSSHSSSGHSCEPGCPPKCQLAKEKAELESKISSLKCALKAAKQQLKANRATYKRCYGGKKCPPPPCPKPAPRPCPRPCPRPAPRPCPRPAPRPCPLPALPACPW